MHDVLITHTITVSYRVILSASFVFIYENY